MICQILLFILDESYTLTVFSLADIKAIRRNTTSIKHHELISPLKRSSQYDMNANIKKPKVYFINNLYNNADIL